jgi:hypothetical protein
LPRFENETHYFADKAFVIRRGQLFAAEETIAKLAGTSRKVVRTGLRTLITGGLITREKEHPSGQCPFVKRFGTTSFPRRSLRTGPTIRPEKDRGRAREGPAETPQVNLRTPKILRNCMNHMNPASPRARSGTADREERGRQATTRSSRLSGAPRRASGDHRMDIGSTNDGRGPDQVVAYFERELAACANDDILLTECCDHAAKSETGVPRTLAWFVGWLECLPARPVMRGAGVAV